MATNTTSRNQRKHAMEALERRFAIAKAEALQQTKHGKKRPLEEDEKGSDSLAIASSSHLTDASVINSPNESAKRGNFTFVGYTTSQDVELSGPTYFRLTQPMHENLLTTDVKKSIRRGSSVDTVLHDLFQKGDSAPKTGASASYDISALQTHSKRSKKHMSMKQLKKSGLFDLPQELQSYRFETYKPMHEMWKGYVLQLIKTTGKNQLAQCLLSADLHGAIILVAECKIAAFTGVSGIMVRETAETFGIVTRDDKFRVVPKKGSVFIFQVDCWKITLLGDKLTSRNLRL
ncbi:hypothetical protein Patl1_32043 [Pistacia atlantica]|uniref:Uncharacterized protein n=1 Tax=Pistacia atlantica TaxID=434234 RepID=A0ACC1APC8_9ROSI|nr:hypothetical protein Patl1_32043 [Pistacia atlantica]